MPLNASFKKFDRKKFVKTDSIWYTATVDLRSLKSGSDIRGNAIAARGEKVNLDAETVKKIGGAFTEWLARKTGKKDLTIAVGHDSRLSAIELKEALIEKFKTCGVTVLDCGLCSTPSVYAMTKHKDANADGAVMITASHHPYHKNGLKFFTREGGLSGGDIDDILELARQGMSLSGNQFRLCREDYLGKYADGLVSLARDKTGENRPLEGIRIVLDAGNGAGGFYAERVLKPLGADTRGSQYLEPDGRFPNHAPNPEDAAAMKSISECVVRNRADLGIIFDTDVDRAAIVLEERKGAYIVTDSVTSDGLKKFITDKGGVHYRYKRGYQNVIGQTKKLIAQGKNAALAIETSGHAAFRENDFLDDGAYLVTRILIKASELKKAGKALLSLISDLEQPASRFETRIFFRDVADYKTYGDTVIRNLAEYAKKSFELEPSAYEGVRANVAPAQGWFLLRQSVHDPNMVLNVESALPDGARKIAKILYRYLSVFKNLDCPGLKAFIE